MGSKTVNFLDNLISNFGVIKTYWRKMKYFRWSLITVNASALNSLAAIQRTYQKNQK